MNPNQENSAATENERLSSAVYPERIYYDGPHYTWPSQAEVVSESTSCCDDLGDVPHRLVIRPGNTVLAFNGNFGAEDCYVLATVTAIRNTDTGHYFKVRYKGSNEVSDWLDIGMVKDVPDDQREFR